MDPLITLISGQNSCPNKLALKETGIYSGEGQRPTKAGIFCMDILSQTFLRFGTKCDF